MLKFFKRLIWRLKHRNINLSDLRNTVEFQKLQEKMVRSDKSYIDYLYDNFGSILEVDRI